MTRAAEIKREERDRIEVQCAASSSLKRLAWAFGCSRKGSPEEQQLEQLLRQRITGEAGK